MTDKTDSRPTHLLWVDVETTGLDPHSDRILEVAMIATGPDLIPLDDGFHTVVAWDGEPDAFIRAMHGPNGLLAECAAPDAPSPEEARAAACGYVARHAEGVRLVPAGSTVRFDRDMLDHAMPGVLAPCHHRSLDVSALYEAARMWAPGALPRVEPTTDHRAPHCLRDSLAWARQWKGLLCSLG